ncbi:hypothetical protein HAX54_009482 [Datura stramonium]|uniref:Uncharacterized protein n=1 Tax=Datura stramonium TaxID=4076 RepID=A0ABS8TGK3_DATST|nr:hypothetical protein [Datura stramonium]
MKKGVRLEFSPRLATRGDFQRVALRFSDESRSLGWRPRRKERGRENGRALSCELFHVAETGLVLPKSKWQEEGGVAPAFCGFPAVKVRREEAEAVDRRERKGREGSAHAALAPAPSGEERGVGS